MRLSPYQHHFLREPLHGNDGNENWLTHLFRLFPLSAGLFPCYTEAELEARRRPVLARGAKTTQLREELRARKTTTGEQMKRTWTSEELLEHFTLLPDELTAVGNKSGATRLGFAVLLKCLQYEGRFPRSRQEVAPDVVRFLATQVGVDAPLFAQYAWEGRTIEAHRAQIREMSKLREFRRADEEALLNWLCAEILTHEQHPERLRELIRAECRTRRIEAPDDIAALIEAGLVAYEAQIYTVIAARLAPEVQQHLDALLVAEPPAEGEEE